MQEQLCDFSISLKTQANVGYVKQKQWESLKQNIYWNKSINQWT